MFDDPFLLLTFAACVVVLLILLWGVGTMARGGEANRKQANKIMRYRIIAQAVAVALILAYVAIRGRG